MGSFMILVTTMVMLFQRAGKERECSISSLNSVHEESFKFSCACRRKRLLLYRNRKGYGE